mmetsp:Transcript_33464/g.93906  ORF Transcript_33464/g.93906 Transcript_33464/m.93906 type:complete len:258 (+) Transcript_33464:149-922(+)
MGTTVTRTGRRVGVDGTGGAGTPGGGTPGDPGTAPSPRGRGAPGSGGSPGSGSRPCGSHGPPGRPMLGTLGAGTPPGRLMFGRPGAGIPPGRPMPGRLGVGIQPGRPMPGGLGSEVPGRDGAEAAPPDAPGPGVVIPGSALWFSGTCSPTTLRDASSRVRSPPRDVVDIRASGTSTTTARSVATAPFRRSPRASAAWPAGWSGRKPRSRASSAGASPCGSSSVGLSIAPHRCPSRGRRAGAGEEGVPGGQAGSAKMA